VFEKKEGHHMTRADWDRDESSTLGKTDISDDIIANEPTARNIIMLKRSAIESALMGLQIGSSFIYPFIVLLYICCVATFARGVPTQLTGAFAILIGITGMAFNFKIWIVRSKIRNMEQIILRDYSKPLVTASKLWADRLMEIDQTDRSSFLASFVRSFKLVEPILWLIVLGTLHLLLITLQPTPHAL
jgi:hypothetical protein